MAEVNDNTPITFHVTGELRARGGAGDDEALVVDVQVSTGVTMRDLYVLFAVAGNSADRIDGYPGAAQAAVMVASELVRLQQGRRG